MMPDYYNRPWHNAAVIQLRAETLLMETDDLSATTREVLREIRTLAVDIFHCNLIQEAKLQYEAK